MKLKALDYIALLFVIIGALNWGLVGLFNWNPTTFVFANLLGIGMAERVIYIVIALAGVYLFRAMFRKENPPAAEQKTEPTQAPQQAEQTSAE